MSQAMPNGVNNAVSADPGKKAEESGGIFGGLFDSKPDESAAVAAGAGAAAAPAPGGTASVTANQSAEGSNVGAEKEKESGGLFSGLLGSKDEEDKTKSVKEEEKPGFFANLLKGDEAPVKTAENAPEADAEPEPEPEPEAVAAAASSGTEEKKADVPLLDRMKGIFSSPSDEKKDGNLDNISESEESEEDESEEDESEEEGDDEVELFLTKIKTQNARKAGLVRGSPCVRPSCS